MRMIIALLATLFLAGPAVAQIANNSTATNANSNTGVNSIRGSGNSRSSSSATGAVNGNVNTGSINATGGSGGRASATGGRSTSISNFTYNDPAATDPANGDPVGSPGAPYTVNESLNGSQTLRNVPEIVPGNVSGGNPCLVGATGGIAVAGFGATLGGGWEDAGCERRNAAALLNNIGERDVAVVLMCQDPHVAQAMATAGHSCGGPIAPPVATVGATTTVAGGQIDPAVVRRLDAIPGAPAPIVAATATAPVKPPRPDWCYTASAAELRAHPQCD